MLKKYLLLIFSLCLVGATLVFVLNRHSEIAQASAGIDMFEQIDSKALAAQSGQQSAVGDLIDTIFAQNGVDQLDTNLVASLKDRLVRAESNGQMVSETQVVQALNWLADQYAAPTYARTSSLQTRIMRLNCIGIMPNLFVDKDGQGNVGREKALYSQPPTNVTPSQAVTLLILMVHQKVLNEGFQKEPAQWDADFYAAQDSGNNYQPEGSGNSPSQIFGRTASQRTNEMQQLVYGTSFNQADQERLAQGVLDQLGIA